MDNKKYLEEIEGIRKNYKRGLITESEAKFTIREDIISAFRDFDNENGVRIHIDQDSFKSMTDDYKSWKSGDKPGIKTGKNWLVYNTETDEVPSDIKIQYFEIIDMFHIPIEYFEPVPAHVVCPDRHPGHYPGEAIIGWKIWENDGGLLTDDFRLGDVVELTDQKGLKSVLKIIKHNRPEDKNRQNGEYDYLAMGTIEGYTSSREREIKIYIEDGKIYYLKTFLMGKDDAEAFSNYPLWKDYNSHEDKDEKIRQEVVNRIFSS